MSSSPTSSDTSSTEPVETLGMPDVQDGSALWRIAHDTRVLDAQPSYGYLLWCRDFAATSVVARSGDNVVGFITGYVRPGATNTLMVWQVAVDAPYRRRGIARRMLDHLADRLTADGLRYLETTISPSNDSSIGLFTSFARGRGAGVSRSVLFDEGMFPDHHDSEVLFRIGPITSS